MTSERLWSIVAKSRNGILATIGQDAIPQLSNIYYLPDPSQEFVRFSTTSVRIKGRNLLRDPRASLHVLGPDFFNFAVVAGRVSLAIAREPDDDAVEQLFDIHSKLGAATERKGFGEEMVSNHRMAVVLQVESLYGQILDR
jgi:PPOX class probable F420-dependent enzyme